MLKILHITSAPKAIFAALGVIEAVDRGPVDAWYRDKDQLADPLAALDPPRDIAAVAQHTEDWSSVVAVQQSGLHSYSL